MLSEFISNAQQIKQRLDAMSPSLCVAKFKQISLYLTTGMNNSCYHPPWHRIPVGKIGRTPGALHNTAHKQHSARL